MEELRIGNFNLGPRMVTCGTPEKKFLVQHVRWDAENQKQTVAGCYCAMDDDGTQRGVCKHLPRAVTSQSQVSAMDTRVTVESETTFTRHPQKKL